MTIVIRRPGPGTPPVDATADAPAAPPTTRAAPEPAASPDGTSAAARRRLPAVPDRYRHDIQGIRGLATLVVVTYHADLGPPGGFAAIELFFVLSGYVITLVVLNEMRTTGRVSVRDFFARRIRRLAPMLAVFSAGTVVASTFVLDNDVIRRGAARTAFAASTIHANLQLEGEGGGYFSAAADLNPFLHTWSLSVEEQFYLVMPLLFAGLWWLGNRSLLSSQLLRVTVTMICITSFALAAGAVAGGDERSAFYLTHLRAWELGIGVLLALNSHRLAGFARRRAQVVAAVGAVLMLGPFLWLDESLPWPGPWAVPSCIGTALVIAAGIGDETRSPVNRALAWRPMQWLGDRSYGWYLWHWPAIVFARVLVPDVEWAKPAAGAGALVLAAITYRLVEQPFRLSRSIRGLAAVVVFLVAAQVPAAVASIVERDAEVAVRPVDDEFGFFTRAWDAGCSDVEWDEATCTTTVPDSQGTVLLLGESSATALSDAVTAAASSIGLSTSVRTVFGCPAVPRGVLDGGEDGGDECERYQAALRDTLEDLQPDLVVISHRSPYWVRPEEGRPIERPDGTPVADGEEALREWRAGLGELLAGIDVPVLLVQMVPEFPDGLDVVVGRDDVDDPRAEILRADVDARRAQVVALEREVADADGDTLVVDPVPVLCGPETCSARTDDGRWRYHDEVHLRAYATAELIPLFRDGMVRLLAGLSRDSNG